MIETAVVRETRTTASAPATELARSTSCDFQAALQQAETVPVADPAAKAPGKEAMRETRATDSADETDEADDTTDDTPPAPANTDLLALLLVPPPLESAAKENATPETAATTPPLAVSVPLPEAAPFPLENAPGERSDEAALGEEFLPIDPLPTPVHDRAKTDTAASPEAPAPILSAAPAATPATRPGPASEQAAPPAMPVPPRDVPQEVAHFVRRLNAEGNTELRVRLDPPALGDIQVVVEQGKDGVSVRIVAQTREALLLLQDQRTPLHEELSRQNIRMDSFSASLAGDTGGQRPPTRGNADSVRVPYGGHDLSVETTPLLVRLPVHTGGLDARA